MRFTILLFLVLSLPNRPAYVLGCGIQQSTSNLWQTQNVYHTIALTSYPAFLAEAAEGDGDALRWVEGFKSLGRLLHFNIGAVLPDRARG